ncbi:MAG TPA: M48 family metallopeptidase [Pyrinomonadaceae bacterium]|nr:M48 family metallopeptidase [Pyrinomonadaceae bacterium]
MLACVLAAQVACGGLLPGVMRASPHLSPGFNLFTPEQDIELGRNSAVEIERQLPLVEDERTTRYINALGARLVAHAPGYGFPYKFAVVDAREVNAFALPGGYVFVNAGAIAAARNEGELAGVLAHEISHVALRHGTTQATKAYLTRMGLGLLGAVTGGEETELGRLVGSFGVTSASAISVDFGRAAETEADIEGARLMAEAGYDPRDMAAFFQNLAARTGPRPTEMLGDHPDPADRAARIAAAVGSLPRAVRPLQDSEEFRRVKSRLSAVVFRK